MSAWFCYAISAAVLYGLHQVFTKMAADRIGDGVGGFLVEASAALTISLYLAGLYFSGHWSQQVSTPGVVYSVLTGICVGVGPISFFLLFQKGGPLSVVPMILAGGAALTAAAGIFFFREPASWPRLLGCHGHCRPVFATKMRATMFRPNAATAAGCHGRHQA